MRIHGRVVLSLVRGHRAFDRATGLKRSRKWVDPGGPEPSGCQTSNDNNLIGQKWMTIGQIEHGLMRKLFCMVRTRTTLQDDFVVRVDDVQVADSPTCDAIDMALDELSEFLMALADLKPKKLCPEVTRRHVRLPT
jgi:hypothetical protein